MRFGISAGLDRLFLSSPAFSFPLQHLHWSLRAPTQPPNFSAPTLAVVVTVPSLFPRVHHLHPLPARGSVFLLSESPHGVPPAGRALSQPRRPAPLEDPSPPRRSSISYSQQAAVQAGKRPRACRGKLPCGHLSPSLLFQSSLGFVFMELRAEFPFLGQNISDSVAIKVSYTAVSASGTQGNALLTCFRLCGCTNLRNCCSTGGSMANSVVPVL